MSTITAANVVSTGTISAANVVSTGTITAANLLLSSSGGGAINLVAPSTASNFTLTAPARTGNIITSGDSGTITSGMIAAGSAGQHLVTNSSGSTAWAQGGWTLINTLTASASATLGDSACFSSSYQYYAVMLESILPATNATGLRLQVYSSAAYQSSAYYFSQIIASNHTTQSNIGYFQITWINNQVSNSSSPAGYSGQLLFFNPSQTSKYKKILAHGTNQDTSFAGPLITTAAGEWQGGTGALTGFQIYFSSGNITSGTVKIYGWN